jgi:hypothetical protein
MPTIENIDRQNEFLRGVLSFICPFIDSSQLVVAGMFHASVLFQIENFFHRSRFAIAIESFSIASPALLNIRPYSLLSRGSSINGICTSYDAFVNSNST